MTSSGHRLAPVGAHLLESGRCSFNVWAPCARSIDLHLLEPRDRFVSLEPTDHGYFQAVVDDVEAGALYRFRLDGTHELPDPASRSQPRGVHGPSAVFARDFPWRDHGWKPPALADYVIYEVHVGTFTTEGTFDATVDHLPYLRDLGVTALELMPVGEFPGARNWGYDGVFPFAAQSTYGGPAALKRLVDACHQAGIAVILDVVYNHVGPEGNCLPFYGHYFTARYRTPWGAALNFDGAHSDHVRDFFIANALQWTGEFHIDALRLDAIHAILDTSARPFLQELACRVHETARADGRTVYLIGETDNNDPRTIRPPELGGQGLDAQWADDFHHALHALLTGEDSGYYCDFGTIDQLAKSFRDGFVYTGQFSRFRMRAHGAPAHGARPEQFVVCSQNHDQVGNRFAGDRLASALDAEALKLAAAAVLLSPFTPLLFMGEEYGETAPFPYFVSHNDSYLIDSVRNGRKEEFAAFRWTGEPPDPQADHTFESARLRRVQRDDGPHCGHDGPDCGHDGPDCEHDGPHSELPAFYRQLTRLRREHRVLTRFDTLETTLLQQVLLVLRRNSSEAALLALNFSTRPLRIPTGALRWRPVLDSSAPEWGGLSTFDFRRSTLDETDGLLLAPRAASLFVAGE